MMLLWLVGLTAMDVSLCGRLCSQAVLTLAAIDVAVVQIGVPILAPGLEPKTALVTGAGASTPLWANSIGCGLSPSSSANAGVAFRNDAANTAAATTARACRDLRRRVGDMRVVPPEGRTDRCSTADRGLPPCAEYRTLTDFT